ncbi:MAG: murein biosynthesis integral membrane protein MurJ, partial [Proteobacteria bacterium]|nr:murein biosynthesis integral membrane protein MurJ [Pseudomonadota bacterium]
AAPIILNATLILSFFIFADVTPNFAYALSWGVFTAGVLQFLYLAFFLIKERVFLYPVIPQFTVQVKQFFKKLLPGVIGANVLQINLLINTMIASLISGAVSYLYYADRIMQLPLAMIGIAIGVVLLPALSREIKKGEEKRAIKMQNTALEASLILAMPAAFALSALAHFIIMVLFERGAFGAVETIFVAKALRLYAFGLPAYVGVKVLEPAFFARGDTKTPMKIAIICLVINIALNIIFFKPFGYIGIVLASVISSYFNFILQFYDLRKRNLFHLEEKFATKFFRIMLSTLIMFAALLLMQQFFYVSSTLNSALELIITIGLGLAIFAVAAYILGVLDIAKAVIKARRVR